MDTLKLHVPGATKEESARALAAVTAYLASVGVSAQEASHAWSRVVAGTGATSSPDWRLRDEWAANAWFKAQQVGLDACFAQRKEQPFFRGWPVTFEQSLEGEIR